MFIIVSMLAVWRATYMLQEETGPFGIFSRLQAWFWSEPHFEGGLKDGLRCFYCTSIWISIPFGVACTFIIDYSPWWTFPIYTLAISAGAIYLNILHNKE